VFDNKEVLSVETKTFFEIKTSAGPIPFNYIWDRFDKFADRDEEYEVVDYKTIRRAMNPDDLRKKIQARFYGLAAQIQVPTAKRIWVRFDLLRHDSVATVFTKEENAATYRFAQRLAEKIIAQDPDDLPENLNPECHFCVRKAACKALTSNQLGGGLWSLTSTEDRIKARAKIEFQRKGLDALIKDLDEVLLKEAAAQDLLELESVDYLAKVTQSVRKGVDAERVEHVVGKDLFHKYGGVALTMANYNKMLKDPALTPSQVAFLRQLVYKTAGDPKISIEPKNAIDD
jgi:hypothetical protein